MKKIYTFRGRKGENEPSDLQNGIWGPKSVWPCDISIDREFYIQQQKIYFGVNKAKISLQSPKMEFGAQNQYDRVIIENFTWS
jgi:hypothetical protein